MGTPSCSTVQVAGAVQCGPLSQGLDKVEPTEESSGLHSGPSHPGVKWWTQITQAVWQQAPLRAGVQQQRRV